MGTSQRLARLLQGALASSVLLAATASGQGYSGTWELQSPVIYFQGGSCPSINFNRIQVQDSFPSVTVDPLGGSSHPGTMHGSFTSPTSFTVTSSKSTGLCNPMQYTMDVDLSGPTLTGSFRIEAPGGFCFCPDDLIPLAGQIQLPSPYTYCTAGTSASGCQAALGANGTPSASLASGFHLYAATVEGDKVGMFFYAANGKQANSWGNGTSFQCVAPPVMRGGQLPASGTTGNCDGLFIQDLNARWCPTCPRPAHNPGAGTVVQAQLWYRDPLSTSNQTTSLSDAIEFQVAP